MFVLLLPPFDKYTQNLEPLCIGSIRESLGLSDGYRHQGIGYYVSITCTFNGLMFQGLAAGGTTHFPYSPFPFFLYNRYPNLSSLGINLKHIILSGR